MSILNNLKKTIGGKKEEKEVKKEIKKLGNLEIKDEEKTEVKAKKKEIKEVLKKGSKEVKKAKKSKSILGKKKKIDKEDIPAEYYNVLKSPHLTERATDLAKENKYVFKIAADANKIQVRKAIENLYGVSVTKVNVVNIPRKRIRYGRGFGFKTGYRKAIVSLKEGERIELVESQ